MVELGPAKKVSETTPAVPFPAIVGQSELKNALLVTGTNDALSGLLIRGEKGTAKSTAARGLPELLPEQRVVADCQFGCPPGDPDRQCGECRERTDPSVETRPVPFVTLPLGASRERVVGTLSVADALEGNAEFDPGLLARANRGILYVDEVNLLEDHLVDVLLDVAASGVNRVERDGVSVTHPADITLVGTMNPEEGELRPQFRDRFDLQVEVRGSDDIEDRVAVLDRALSGFDGDFERETEDLRERLRSACERLDDVSIPESLLVETAELCQDAGVEGHRGDIATARTARTLAALDGRERVIEPDIRTAASFALPHRLKSRPFEETPDPDDIIEDHFEDDADADDCDASEDAHEGTDGDGDSSEAETESEDSQSGEGSSEGSPDDSEAGQSQGEGESGSESGGNDDDGDVGGQGGRESGGEPQPAPAGSEASGTDGDTGGAGEGGGREESDGSDDGESQSGDDSEEGTPLVPGQSRSAIGNAGAPDIEPDTGVSAENTDRVSGSRTNGAQTARGTGARVRTEPADGGTIDASASVRAAAARGSETVESRDLRQSVHTSEQSALVVFALDASASMRGPMRVAKGVVMELLQDAYENRDEVAVVTFAGDDGDVLLPPTDSVSMAARHLKEVPTADRTPLAAGLRTVGDVLDRADPALGVVVLVTDGRANAGDGSPTAETRRAAKQLAGQDAHVVVVDAGDATDRTTLTEAVTRITDGDRIALDALTADRVDVAVGRAASRE
jgi:magnesium chelatase subunit D